MKGEVGFANADANWSEDYDLVALAASALGARGHGVANRESWLEHEQSGLVLVPQIVHFQPIHKAGVRTTTTLQVHHPVLVPEGVFEYQHSTGDNLKDSFIKGFDQWAQTDFVAFLDALQSNPRTCTTLHVAFPEKDGKPAYSRRAVLGPVAHYVENPRVYSDQKVSASGKEVQNKQSEKHDFCPCCLLTNSFETFKELIESDRFYGLRLFAARDGEGMPQADCRVNGDDWEKGVEALRKYAMTWPAAGYEFRKQYVILQTLGKGSSP